MGDMSLLAFVKNDPLVVVDHNHVVRDGRLIGLLTELHLDLIRAAEALRGRGYVFFDLAEIIEEYKFIIPDSEYREATIEARCRELAQWTIFGRQQPGSRKGKYSYYGGFSR